MAEEKNKHTLLKIAGVTAVAGTAAYAGAGYAIFRNAFDLTKSAFYSDENGIKRLTKDAGEKSEWFARSTRDDEFIDSYDGLKLHALRITNHAEGHKWLIVLHGLGSYSGGMLDYLWEADQRGFNVLAIDSRGCGMSEGKYTGLGWNEHYDLISWLNHLLNIDSGAQIALLGVNAGAAAVMNAVGDYLPANVKCAIEDGGFSGIREEIMHMIRKTLNVDGKLLMPSVDFYVRQFLHFSMNDVSIRRQLRQSVTPMLFVHGTDDEIVPTSMLFDNYYSCASAKDLYTAEGKGFGETAQDPEYFNAIFSFIGKYIVD
jgi:hypothetical protein